MEHTFDLKLPLGHHTYPLIMTERLIAGCKATTTDPNLMSLNYSEFLEGAHAWDITETFSLQIGHI